MFLPVLPLMLAVSMQAAPPQQAAPRQAPSTPAVAAAQRPAAPRKIYNETADAKAQIATAIKAAAEDDIRVLINWGANDDERCSKLPQAQRAPELTGPKFFSDEYKVVTVDVGHLDKNQDVAAAYGAKLSAGALPAFTVLDKTGKPIAQASAPDLVTDTDATAFDAKKMAAFLATNQAPAPDANAPFNAAVAEAKREGKEVFLWFSAPW